MLEDGHLDRDQFSSGSDLRAGDNIPEISTCGPVPLRQNRGEKSWQKNIGLFDGR